MFVGSFSLFLTGRDTQSVVVNCFHIFSSFCLFLPSNRFLYGDQARYFEAEVKPRLKHTKKGLVSMVNDGNNMHGSQVSLLTSRYRLVVASGGKWWQVTELYFILTISLV